MVKYFNITENKTLEIQMDFWKDQRWFGFSAGISRKEDHAGLRISLHFFGLYFHTWFCDNRHWDYENNRWYTEEDEPTIWGSKVGHYKGADQGTLGPDD